MRKISQRMIKDSFAINYIQRIFEVNGFEVTPQEVNNVMEKIKDERECNYDFGTWEAQRLYDTFFPYMVEIEEN